MTPNAWNAEPQRRPVAAIVSALSKAKLAVSWDGPPAMAGPVANVGAAIPTAASVVVWVVNVIPLCRSSREDRKTKHTE
jgi:hypothetical protein